MVQGLHDGHLLDDTCNLSGTSREVTWKEVWTACHLQDVRSGMTGVKALEPRAREPRSRPKRTQTTRPAGGFPPAEKLQIVQQSNPANLFHGETLECSTEPETNHSPTKDYPQSSTLRPCSNSNPGEALFLAIRFTARTASHGADRFGGFLLDAAKCYYPVIGVPGLLEPSRTKASGTRALVASSTALNTWADPPALTSARGFNLGTSIRCIHA